MSRLAACVTSPLLLLLLLVGSPSWSEPAAPAAVAPAAAPKPGDTTVMEAIRAARELRAARAGKTIRLALASTGTAAEAAPAAAPEPPKLEITGFVDGYYEYNFNRPDKFITDTTGARVRNDVQNELRNFDFKDNEFALNLAEISFERKPAPVGFKAILAFGKATDWIHSTEPGGGEVYKHILQAYLTVPLKFLGKEDTLDVGKFVTPTGAEVIETKDNWNYTRSLLFAWAIPYYHAGLRYKHPINAASAVQIFLINGWNDVEDNNNSLSYGVSYNTALGKKLSLVQSWLGGPELPDDAHNWRHLFDTVLTYNASDKTAYMLNFDYLTEDRDAGSISWKGVALYARHALSERNAFVLRGEWFSDDDGASTGTAQEVKEVTATYEMKGRGGLLTRAELRYDWSNKDVFDNRNSGKKDNQLTVLLGAVYAF